MNSACSERVQGFLKSRSVPHSVEVRLKSGVRPASSSSQFSMGVTSTATVGPELPSSRLREPAAPSSRTAIGSFSFDCAAALREHRHKEAISTVILLVLLVSMSASLWLHFQPTVTTHTAQTVLLTN